MDRLLCPVSVSGTSSLAVAGARKKPWGRPECLSHPIADPSADPAAGFAFRCERRPTTLHCPLSPPSPHTLPLLLTWSSHHPACLDCHSSLLTHRSISTLTYPLYLIVHPATRIMLSK